MLPRASRPIHEAFLLGSFLLSLSLYLSLCVSLSLYLSWMLLTHCQDHTLTENIWFVWSRTSYSGDKWRCHRCGTDGRTTNKQGKIGLLSQWMLDGLSFAISYFNFVLSKLSPYPKLILSWPVLFNVHSGSILWASALRLCQIVLIILFWEIKLYDVRKEIRPILWVNVDLDGKLDQS